MEHKVHVKLECDQMIGKLTVGVEYDQFRNDQVQYFKNVQKSWR